MALNKEVTNTSAKINPFFRSCEAGKSGNNTPHEEFHRTKTQGKAVMAQVKSNLSPESSPKRIDNMKRQSIFQRLSAADHGEMGDENQNPINDRSLFENMPIHEDSHGTPNFTRVCVQNVFRRSDTTDRKRDASQNKNEVPRLPNHLLPNEDNPEEIGEQFSQTDRYGVSDFKPVSVRRNVVSSNRYEKEDTSHNPKDDLRLTKYGVRDGDNPVNIRDKYTQTDEYGAFDCKRVCSRPNIFQENLMSYTEEKEDESQDQKYDCRLFKYVQLPEDSPTEIREKLTQLERYGVSNSEDVCAKQKVFQRMCSSESTNNKRVASHTRTDDPNPAKYILLDEHSPVKVREKLIQADNYGASDFKNVRVRQNVFRSDITEKKADRSQNQKGTHFNAHIRQNVFEQFDSTDEKRDSNDLRLGGKLAQTDGYEKSACMCIETNVFQKNFTSDPIDKERVLSLNQKDDHRLSTHIWQHRDSPAKIGATTEQINTNAAADFENVCTRRNIFRKNLASNSAEVNEDANQHQKGDCNLSKCVCLQQDSPAEIRRKLAQTDRYSITDFKKVCVICLTYFADLEDHIKRHKPLIRRRCHRCLRCRRLFYRMLNYLNHRCH